MKIYIDILIITNIFVTYFLIQSTGLLLHKKVQPKRMVMGAIFGGCCSLIILISVSPLLIAVIKVLIAVCICILSFGIGSWKMLMKATISFYIISFLYGGLMFALWYFVTPAGMQYRNGVAYFNVSAVVLVLSTVLAYFVIRLFQFWLRKTPKAHQRVQVQIECNGKSVLVSGFVDTGNHLADIISGNPVWICELKALYGLFPHEVYEAIGQGKIETIDSIMWKTRIRLIPMQSVTGGGLIPCFRPDRVWLIDEKSPPFEKQVMIGITAEPISDGEFSIIVNESAQR